MYTFCIIRVLKALKQLQKFIMKKFSVVFSIAVCLMVLISSCSTNGGGTNPQQGYFLIADISPNSKSLAVYVNGSLLGSGLNYGNYTPYYGAAAGGYTFNFTDSANNTVLSNTVNIQAQVAYDYYLIDSFSKIKSAFIQNNYVAPASDSTLVRFFNFCPNAPVPVSLVDAATSVKWFSNRSFNDQSGTQSYTEYTKVPAGIYTFKLTNIFDSVLSTRVDTLVGGHVYSLFAKGFYNGTGNQAIGVGRIQNY